MVLETPTVVGTTTEQVLSTSAGMAVFLWTDFVTKIVSQQCKIMKLYRCVAETKVKAKFEDRCGLRKAT